MLAKRLPLLSAFAIGCLSGAALLATWRYGPERAPSSARAPERNFETVELAFADAMAQERDAPSSDAIAPDHTAELAAETPAETGASAAEVLTRLEAAYRQGLAAAQPAAPASVAAAPSAVPPVAAPPVAAPPVAAAPVAATAPITNTAPALAPAVTLPAVVPATAVVARAAAPPANPAPMPAANLPSPPSEAVAVRDVQQNIHVGDAHQGDVFQVQLQQQLAILQYMQLLGLSPYGGPGGPVSAPPRGTRRRAPPFPTSLTNPDNPWGFDFPPTVLVK